MYTALLSALSLLCGWRDAGEKCEQRSPVKDFHMTKE